MDLGIAGRKAIVCASSKGLGRACARALAEAGCAIVLNGRDAEALARTARELREATGVKVGEILGDLDDPATRLELIAACPDADILVNNVGGSTSVSHPSWFDAPPEEWADNYQQNLLPAVRMIQALVPEMRDRRWGRVIQISSRNAISPHAQLGGYGAAKAAMNNLTLSLSKALAGTGVTSNGIMPGLVETPQLHGWFVEMARKHTGSADPEIGKAFVLKNIVHQTVGRLGRPRDIAAAAVFLASPLTDFMTGTTIRIDGGSTPTI